MENLLAKLKVGNNKKQIENIVIFIVLLVIIIIVINSLFATGDTMIANDENTIQTLNTNHEIDDTEYRLKNILSCISGVGNVEVMISYSNTVEDIPMYDMKENTTLVEESDVNGRKAYDKRNTKRTKYYLRRKK